MKISRVKNTYVQPYTKERNHFEIGSWHSHDSWLRVWLLLLDQPKMLYEELYFLSKHIDQSITFIFLFVQWTKLSDREHALVAALTLAFRERSSWTIFTWPSLENFTIIDDNHHQMNNTLTLNEVRLIHSRNKTTLNKCQVEVISYFLIK